MNTSAIIAAGGAGTRMSNAGTVKQFLDLGGKSILERTLDAVSASSIVDGIVLVLRAEDLPVVGEEIASGYPKVKRVVAGGASRMESVRNGVSAADSEYVLIHDAARPFVSTEVIERVMNSALAHGAATAVIAVSDTLRKRSGEFLGPHIEREEILMVQTPQAFRRELLLAAYRFVENSGEFTDETSIVSLAGSKVSWVEGDPANIKITTPADLKMARRLSGLV